MILPTHMVGEKIAPLPIVRLLLFGKFVIFLGKFVIFL